MTNQRIEDAKNVVEWSDVLTAPGFEVSDKENRQFRGHEIILVLDENGEVSGDSDDCYETTDLWEDHNLLQEVLDEIEERGFVYSYIQNFWEVANTVGKDPMDETMRGWQIHTADPETIFKAIVATLGGGDVE
jgi:hypothetical protein